MKFFFSKGPTCLYRSSTPVDDLYTFSFFFLALFSSINIMMPKLCHTHNIAKWLYFILITSNLRNSPKFFFYDYLKKNCMIRPQLTLVVKIARGWEYEPIAKITLYLCYLCLPPRGAYVEQWLRHPPPHPPYIAAPRDVTRHTGIKRASNVLRSPRMTAVFSLIAQNTEWITHSLW